MRPSSALLASLLILLAGSCGNSPSTPNEALDAGYSSLNSGDHSAAISHFESALAGLDPGSEEYVGAKVGQLQSLAHTDAARAKTELLALSPESGIGAQDYRIIVEELVKAATAQISDPEASKATMAESFAILAAGKTKFPAYPDWAALVDRTGKQAEKMGNADMGALKGLGYVGED